MTDLTPETRAEWRKDAEADPWWAVESVRIIALLDALEKAERERDSAQFALDGFRSVAQGDNAHLIRERDEAREALARVEALADWYEARGASGKPIRAALAGPNSTNTEGDDRD